jgi:hypothetical protein
MNNPPAFPSSNEVTLNDWVSSGHSGMTLRDYFAAKAMQAQLSLPETLLAISKKQITADQVCGSCYEWANAMLKAREG